MTHPRWSHCAKLIKAKPIQYCKVKKNNNKKQKKKKKKKNKKNVKKK